MCSISHAFILNNFHGLFEILVLPHFFDFSLLLPLLLSLQDLVFSLALKLNIPRAQMAAQEGSPAPSAQVVGNAFVEQYYQILHQSPGLVHRFYQDSSLLSRPDSNGAMATVTTMQAINDKILSLKYEDYTAEIKTADAQESYEKGVIVLVTGCLTGKDNLRKKFTQSFFLAPQDKGYFVLNDIFRYVEESESLQISSDSVNSINENASTADVTQAPEPAHDHLSVDRAIAIEGEDLDNGAEVCDPSDKEDGSVIDDEVVEPPTNSVQNEINTTVDSAPIPQEDAPTKKSYASIVKVTKGITVSTSPAYVPSSKVRQAPANTDQQSLAVAKPAPVPEVAAPSSDSGLESSSVNEEAEGCSIYVRNLPFNATPAQLEEVFKNFGPIKKHGIQVRSNKQGYCFGFVAFEMPSSVQNALEASPIIIGDRQADVEAKRANSRVGGGGRGRFSSGRGGFRNDSFKGRGSFGGGRGYGRSEFRGQGEFSGRPKGSSARNGEGQGHGQGQGRVNQNGSRRGGPQGGAYRSSVAA
ncbi:hypothetical protein QYF36_003786 [Acer negundo]|nr:hypothetical protein QYF36_003786 [Acer negundo]